MKIDLLIDGAVAQTWTVPDGDIEISDNWNFRERCEFRMAVVERWVDSMRTCYQKLMERMGMSVSFQVTFGSKANIIEITDEEMEDFNKLISNSKMKLNESRIDD